MSLQESSFCPVTQLILPQFPSTIHEEQTPPQKHSTSRAQPWSPQHVAPTASIPHTHSIHRTLCVRRDRSEPLKAADPAESVKKSVHCHPLATASLPSRFARGFPRTNSDIQWQQPPGRDVRVLLQAPLGSAQVLCLHYVKKYYGQSAAKLVREQPDRKGRSCFSAANLCHTKDN